LNNALQLLLAPSLSEIVTNPSFREFAQHVVTHLQEMAKKEKVKGESAYFLTVKQWKKEDVATFFLGDQVGCCLATDNERFAAMVQRRMDDAMLFHTVVDQKTGKVISLIWLYLAEIEREGKKELALIANFFEVQASHGQDQEMRLVLRDLLLRFTAQYMKETGISHFYMNELGYGYFKNDLTAYPVKKVTLIDKVGGAFIPVKEDEGSQNHTCSKEETDKRYYLASLLKEDFHEFDPMILNQQSNPAIQTVEDLIETTLWERVSAEPGLPIKAALKIIAKECGGKLSPFFKESSEWQDHPRFVALVTEVLKKMTHQPSEQEGATVFPKAVSRPLNSFVFSVAFTPKRVRAANWVLTV
jgi:hypothetical protein